MKSPFPGMDPFLEGHLWPDAHNSLAHLIKTQLAPRVSPNYLVQINTYTVEDTSPEEDVGVMYPEVEVLGKGTLLREPEVAYGKEKLAITPATLVIPATSKIEVRIPEVEIRDRKNNRLITAIEILSPVNKRKPGLELYREKRQRLHEAKVHLVEIDLLRRGQRPFKHPYLPVSHYFVNLVRAGSWKTEVWAIDVKDMLPVLPVPLKAPDEDTFLDLRKAMQDLYEQSLYHLAINYRETPPPPVFSNEDKVWMEKLLVNFIS
jgi:hypothetical protein